MAAKLIGFCRCTVVSWSLVVGAHGSAQEESTRLENGGRPEINEADDTLELDNSLNSQIDARQRFIFPRDAYERQPLGPEGLRLDPFNPNDNHLPPEARIANGNATLGFGAVGALLIGELSEGATIRCSGTMIGCETFLTANHCVAGFREPSSYHVFLQSEGILPVVEISPEHEDYDKPRADLAVLKLGHPVEAAQPVELNTSSSGADTSVGQIVGFGYTASNSGDQGIKRYGDVEIVSCDGVPGDDSQQGVLCWEFDGQLSTTCNIDSGGPLFFQGDAGETLLGGVTSTTDSQCDTEFRSEDVDVAEFIEWIGDQGGDDVGQLSCGLGSAKLYSNLPFFLGELILSPGEPDEHTYVIPEAANRIHVALNGQDDPDLDFDLDARISREDLTTGDTCSAHGQGNFAFCEFDVADGDLLVQVTVSLEGETEGSYQLTVTAL